MRVLGGDDVDAVVSMDLALAAATAAAAAVAAQSVVTGRVQVSGSVAWMRVLAGMVSGLDLLGYKEFHRVGKDVRYHVHLFRESTGEPWGIVDGRRITSLRTAATAAVAARHWSASRGAASVAVVGSGEEAREGLRALAAALQVSKVRVYSPTPANREGFAVAVREDLGVPAVAAATVEEALEGADIAYIATSSQHTPFLSVELAATVGLVLAIGATRPEHRELDGSVFLRAGAVVVDTRDALQEAGDCIAARAEGFDVSKAMLLGDYLQCAPVSAAGAPVLFKSIGSVEQDLVLAHHLLLEAERVGVGRIIDAIASLRVMR